MTSVDPLDPFARRISDALDQIADARPPAYLDAVLRQTARTPQRPRWAIPERWLPMDTAATVLPRRFPAMRLVLVILALAALLAGLAVIGTFQPMPQLRVLGIFERVQDLPRQPTWAHVLRLRDGSVLVADGRILMRFDPANGTWAELADTEHQIRGWTETPSGEIVGLHVEENLEEPEQGQAWVVAERLPVPGTAGPSQELARSDPFHLQNAVALRDGRILILGQDFGVEAVVALIFDPGAATFTRAGSTPLVANPERAVTLTDGRVLVIDQAADADAMNVVVYDVATGSFTRLASLPVAAMFSLTALADGRALVAGGGVTPADGPGVPTSAAFIVDPTAGTVAPVQPLATPRWMHAAAPMADGRLLLAGGSVAGAIGTPSRSTLVFDPVTLTFAPGPDMLDARMNATAVPLADGRILIFGHSTLVQSPPSAASVSAEVFR